MKRIGLLSLLLVSMIGMNTGLAHAHNDTEEVAKSDHSDMAEFAVICGVGVVVGAGSVWAAQALMKDEKEEVPKKYAEEILLLKNRNKEVEKAFLKLEGSLKQEKNKRVKGEKNERALKRQIAELQEEIDGFQEHDAYDELEDLHDFCKDLFKILGSKDQSERKLQAIQGLKEQRKEELENAAAHVRSRSLG